MPTAIRLSQNCNVSCSGATTTTAWSMMKSFKKRTWSRGSAHVFRSSNHLFCLDYFLFVIFDNHESPYRQIQKTHSARHAHGGDGRRCQPRLVDPTQPGHYGARQAD